jgi:hypothetical protein
MDALSEARIRTVRDHMALECACDWDAVIATFAHPRYEMYGSGAVFDGEAAVRGYFAASRTPFPDQGNEIIAIGVGGDTVLVEFWLTGTHLGPLRLGGREIAPTGRPSVCGWPPRSSSRRAATRSYASGRTSTRARCSGRSGFPRPPHEARVSAASPKRCAGVCSVRHAD